jgi:hypothetical protein
LVVQHLVAEEVQRQRLHHFDNSGGIIEHTTASAAGRASSLPLIRLTGQVGSTPPTGGGGGESAEPTGPPEGGFGGNLPSWIENLVNNRLDRVLNGLDLNATVINNMDGELISSHMTRQRLKRITSFR